MRILMVIGQFRPTIGGAERQCEILAHALGAAGHAVRVITLRPERGIPTHETTDGAVVERVSYPILRIAGKRISFGFLAPFLLAWRAWRLLPGYDVVIAHQALWPAFVASIVARWCGKPVIVKLGNSGERFDLDVLVRTHWYGAFARRFLLRHVRRFIATSGAVRADLHRARVPDERIADIPNGVAIPLAPADRPVRTSLRAVFVGTLTPKKNIGALLEAIAHLPDAERARVACAIVGDGSECAALKQRAQVLGVAARIEWHGMVADPTPFLAAADVFVLPSWTEGLSNAALEACATGCALLLSDAGGNPDLVPDARPMAGEPFRRGTTGILIDPESSVALAAALRWLLAHPDERRSMGDRARAFAEDRYAITRVTAAYEALLRAVTQPRVIHLCTFLDSRGGMERQALQLAHALRARGSTARFLTSAHLDRMWRERLSLAGWIEGFPVYRIPFLRGCPRLNSALYTIGGLACLFALQSRYDIIHAHQLHTSGLVASIARRLLPRKRVVVKNACSGAYGDVGNLVRLAGGRATPVLRRSVSAFVGVGAETVAEMEALALHPIVAIPNSVRTDAFAPADPATRENTRRRILRDRASNATLILSVGRLHAQKNLTTLVDACAMLDDAFVLLLVGDGPERSALERYRVQRGLASRVWFVGAVDDVRPYYHAADVFALASWSEGMPNVVLEAMACGLPIVASDIPPVRAIVRHVAEGVLVPPDDAAEFAAAIRGVAGDRARSHAMGMRARERILTEFSVDAAAARYATLYANVAVR